MRKPYHSNLDELIAQGVKDNLFDDQHGRAMLKLFKVGLADDVIMGMILYRLNKHYREELWSDHPFKIPPGGKL